MRNAFSDLSGHEYPAQNDRRPGSAQAAAMLEDYNIAFMHELTPSEVAMAVRTAMTVWRMNFQFSRFIFMVVSFFQLNISVGLLFYGRWVSGSSPSVGSSSLLSL